jgi:signal transduction histidine kinase
MTPRFSPLHSLQWRLPALFGALLVVVVVVLTALGYRSLERILVAGASERLAGAAGLLRDAMLPGLERGVRELGALADSGRVAAAFTDPDRREEALTLLRARPGVTPATTVQLRALDGSCLAALRGGGMVEGTSCIPIAMAPGDSAFLQPLQVIGDTAWLSVVAPVHGDAGAPPLGYVLQGVPLVTPASSLTLIEGLIGSEAGFYLANADGSVWTDLSAVVPAPHDQPLTPDSLLTYDADGEPQLAFVSALGSSPLVLALEFPRAAVLGPRDAFLKATLFIGFITVVAGVVAAWLVSARIARPLRQATIAAEQVASGHADRVDVAGADEVGRFATAFNVMAEEVKKSRHDLEARVEKRTQLLKETLKQLRDAQGELVRKEKLATLGQLSSSVGHELRNPLGVMSNSVYYLKMVLRDQPPNIGEYLDILKHQINLSEKIVSDLLDFARVKPPQTETLAVADLVAAQLERVGRPQGIEIVSAVPGDLPPVKIDRVQIGQVLFNLLTNAVQAMDGGGTLRVSAEPLPGGTVRLTVTDTGTGITPEQLERIFDPLFTTKARGIGLGLSVARSLARANQGDIEVASEPGKGSTFAVLLPAAHRGVAA